MTKFEQIVRSYGERLQSDLGIDAVQAAGIFGNLGGETGGFTLLQEQKPLVAGSRGGYGWMQWTGPRRVKYEKWAQANNLNVADDETNYRYLVKETTTDEKASLAALKRTKSVETATENFCNKNLRPGIPHMDVRKRWAQKAYDILMHKTAPVVAEQPVATPGKAVATGAVLTGGTVAAAAASPTHLVPYILIGGLAIAVIAWAIVHFSSKKEDEHVG